jgi:hypothetical protein
MNCWSDFEIRQRSQYAAPGHTQAGHPEGTKQVPGVDTRAKGAGHVM